MKRRILSLLLALSLCVGLAVPALAADDGITPLPNGTNSYGHHYFHNGLVPVNLEEGGWVYLNTKGEIVDFGKGNYVYVFDFSEGYAPFITRDFKLGYMDAAGKVVVPAQYDFFDNNYGMIYAGRVIGGQALVYNNALSDWEQINMRGQKVARTLDPDNENVIYSDAVGNTDGVTFETLTIDGEEMELGFSEGYALSYEYIVKQGYVPEEKEPVEEEEPIEEAPFSIYFYEKGIDYANGAGYNYTLTNNTDKTITGYYALMSYYVEDDVVSTQFHPFDINLSVKESVSGIVASNFYNLSNAKMCWLEFNSKAERDSFFADSIFYDAHGHYIMVAYEARSLEKLESMLGFSLEK